MSFKDVFFSSLRYTDAESKDNYANWCLIALIGVLFTGALVITIIAGVTLSHRPTNSGTDADDYELLVRSDGSGKGSVANLPPVYVVQRPSTPSNITSGPVPSGPTPLAPPLTVCTLAPGAEYMYIPYDGLCDYSFFDSLAITPESNGFAVTTQSADAKRFVAQAQIDKKTLYGMSVSLRDVVAFSNAFQSGSGKADYETYWKFNVFHWGFLHVDELQVDANIAGEIHEHAVSTAGQTPGTFLGHLHEVGEVLRQSGRIYPAPFSARHSALLCLRDRQITSLRRHLFTSQLRRTVFTPTGVVVLGHLSYGDSWKSDCVIMPPVNYVDPRLVKPGIGYGHNMQDAMHAVTCLWNRGVQSSLSLSVTMQARRYKMRGTAQGRALFYTDCEPATYEQRTTAQEICDDPQSGYSRNIYYATQEKSPITYDDSDGFAVTFENEISMREKLCDAWSRGAIPVPVGLAVYDANYDRRSSRCDRRWINGTWSRFRYLLRLRDFLHHGQRSSTFSQDCNRVT
ncbi:hypothetical protein HPB51_008483 [Rhipicephalus microplus]|uniref:Uncharacterized protein n=1 Tax=Rhipicephalus microplus TaxID=6941 RepID=A0A9J6ERB4_RHIMP|nr:hypothetical protein HPB51_008483 [Rhipicephalus microplus]